MTADCINLVDEGDAGAIFPGQFLAENFVVAVTQKGLGQRFDRADQRLGMRPAKIESSSRSCGS